MPGQVQAQIVDDPLKSPMLAAFRLLAGVDSRRQTAPDLTARAPPPITHGSSRQRSRSCTTFCRRSTCRHAARRPTRSALPNGAVDVRLQRQWHTTTDTTPQQIHEIGLAEVKRIRAEMDAVMASTGFTGSDEDFMTFLRTDPRFYFKDAASLLTAYRDIAKRADPELARLFGRLPRTPYGVQPVPDAIAPSQTTAYYEPGALDGRAARLTCLRTPTSSTRGRSGRWRR